MAINKQKNVCIQITIPKEDHAELVKLHNAFNKNGIKVSKSEILVNALHQYIRILVACGLSKEQQKAKEDKKDA